jgi:hypothetical protein
MAKPENWDLMSEREKYDRALMVYQGPRGAWLIQEALEVAIPALRALGNDRPESDIQDMEMILEAIFSDKPPPRLRVVR